MSSKEASKATTNTNDQTGLPDGWLGVLGTEDPLLQIADNDALPQAKQPPTKTTGQSQRSHRTSRLLERIQPLYDDEGGRDQAVSRNVGKLQLLLRDGVGLLDRYGLLPHLSRLSPQQLKAVTPIAHTHWDREWYEPFEVTRQKLVTELMPTILELLETQPQFKMEVDGQVSLVYDYLGALPPAKRQAEQDRIQRQVKDQRLALGRFYTAGDMLLGSGETTLRNFGYGELSAKRLGQAGEIGYFPDQFGLPATLPKICQAVGITKIIAQRGKEADWPQRMLWEADDGSQVEVFFLETGYFHWNQRPAAMRSSARLAQGRPSLFLAGYDYAIPRRRLVNDVARAGIKPLATLSEFFASLPALTTPYVHRGEIRAAGRYNILPNVISNRVDLRQLYARAELSLERYAEVLAAAGLAGDSSVALDTAWRQQIYNQAHDSMYLSVADEVAQDITERTHGTIHAAETIIQQSLATLGDRLASAGSYVWNPSNFERDFYDAQTGQIATKVPPLGWSQVKAAALTDVMPERQLPPMRFSDQIDRGDTYTFDPRKSPRSIELPVRRSQLPGEPFTRLQIAWENRTDNHRVRLLIKLPQKADSTIADTAFGAVRRPLVATPAQGRDRLNGYPARKFIVAGGLVILLDRVVEYELLPRTNELAITLLRAHGALSVAHPKYRLGGAGPHIATVSTQVQGEIAWELGIMERDEAAGLPYREWEQFGLPFLLFDSAGGGKLPASGMMLERCPDGVLSAVLPVPGKAGEVLVRTFSQETHRIHHTVCQLQI